MRSTEHVPTHPARPNRLASSLKFAAYAAGCLFALQGTSSAALLVDFSDSTANVAPTAAGFIFPNLTAGPVSRIFTSGSQGYTGGSLDTGSGITTVLQAFNVSDGSPSTNVLRLVDRSDAAADLVSDWASVDPQSAVQSLGLRLTITGLKTGVYTFTSAHDDTSNQGGVLDAQYSVDGGANWLNLVDNAPYDNGATVTLSDVSVTAANGLSLRYLAGGKLFGASGGDNNGDGSNRFVPLNSFEIQAVPEPTTGALVAAAAACGLLRRRSGRRSAHARG